MSLGHFFDQVYGDIVIYVRKVEHRDRLLAFLFIWRQSTYRDDVGTDSDVVSQSGRTGVIIQVSYAGDPHALPDIAKIETEHRLRLNVTAFLVNVSDAHDISGILNPCEHFLFRRPFDTEIKILKNQ